MQEAEQRLDPHEHFILPTWATGPYDTNTLFFYQIAP